MIGMAARALLARRIRPDEGGMQAAMVRNAVTDFRVALETLQLCRPAAQVVAFRAIRRPGQRLVCLRKRTGRNLGANGKPCKPGQNGQNADEKADPNEDCNAFPTDLLFGEHLVSGDSARTFDLEISQRED
jgi:hypothetical protein